MKRQIQKAQLKKIKEMQKKLVENKTKNRKKENPKFLRDSIFGN